MRTTFSYILLITLISIGCEPQNMRNKLRLDDLSGNSFVPSDEDYLLVNFWATWCKPCIEELPSLHRLKGHISEDVHIILVSNENTEKVAAFAEKYEITLPLYLMPTAIEDFKLQFLPTTMLFSPFGEVLFVEEGERVWDSPDMIQQISDAVKAD